MTAIRAAIYARKSTDDSARNLENRSATRQIERARAYAKAKGWTVAEDHIYKDEGISGADFENRPGFSRMLDHLPKGQKKPPFDVLVMSEASRLGRDQQRTPFYRARIHDCGVRIFYYLDDVEEKLDDPMQILVSGVYAFKDEEARRDAGKRSLDALLRKAAKGYNAGGVVYGYDNVPVYQDGSMVKSHTDYRINKAQADVIRRICRAFVAGHGHVSIAKALNGEPRYAALLKNFFDGQRPAPPRKGTGSWAPSSVHKILRNERYTGVVAYGAFRKTYKHGAQVRVRRPANEVQRVQRPDLRIIPKELWEDVQKRLAAGRKTYLRDTFGKLWGRPAHGGESKYLLTGFGECAVCGHSVGMIGGKHYYGCVYHQSRGRTVCDNGLHVRTAEADALVIDKIHDVLTPAAIDYTIDKSLKLLAEQRRKTSDDPARLEAEARKLQKELARFMALIAGGTAPASVMAEIQRREARLVEIEAERRTLVVEEPSELDLRRLRKGFRARLADFKGLLLGDVPAARQALRQVISGRIEFRPIEGDYQLRWSLSTGALMGAYTGMASPGGFEPPYSP